MVKCLGRWFKKILRRLFGNKWVVPNMNAPVANPQLLTDVEYELLFMQLLAGVNDEGWSHGRIQGFLAGNNVAETDLVRWLRGFGERLLAEDGENRELAVRMVGLSEVGCGELSEVAAEIGRKLLGKCTEEETNEEKEEAEVWLKKGCQQVDSGDYEGSIISSDQALKLKPNSHQAWYVRGDTMRNLECYEEAIASFDQALKFKPDDYLAWFQRGNILDKLERYQEAISSYNQALKLKPDYHLAWFELGNILDKLEKLERYEEAIAYCDQAFNFKPDYHQIWYNQSNMLCKLGRYEEAISTLR